MDLQTLRLMEGRLPSRCLNLVREWGQLHQQELLEMWDTQNFHRIDPLE